uniref:Uncharacterized protein n=1 Tax=Athene cunicularia TaxID=194338 RepID=A0A663MXA2_ATHCN
VFNLQEVCCLCRAKQLSTKFMFLCEVFSALDIISPWVMECYSDLVLQNTLLPLGVKSTLIIIRLVAQPFLGAEQNGNNRSLIRSM